MPLETEQLPQSRALTEKEQHDSARAFIAEANAEIERLIAEIENAKAILPESEPTQEQIDDVIAGAEALTQAAAQANTDTLPPALDDHALSEEHVDDIHAAIERLDDQTPPPPDSPVEPGDNGGNSGDSGQPPSDLAFSYDRANVEADAHQLADMYAEKRISDDLEQGNRFNKLVKRAFEGNIARQFYRERYKLEYERLVKESGGQIYAPIEQLYGMDAENATEASRAALRATLERVMSDDPRMIREQEDSEHIAQDAEVEGRLRAAIKDLALRYAAGELDDMSVLSERDRLFSEIEGLNDTLFGNGIHFADNMLELARNVRAEAAHADGLDRVQAALDGIVLAGAVAKSGANVELKQTIFDKISKKIRTSRIGGTAIATGVLLAGAIVFSGSRRAAQSSTAAALRLTAVGAGAAGAIAAGNEYASARREAAFGRTEHAFGIEHDDSKNGRRREMNQINFEAQDVNRAIEEMRIYIDASGRFPDEAGDQDLLDAQALHTRLRMLNEYGEEHKIDLLRFSGVAASARERLDFLQTLCELEAAIEGRLGMGGDIVVGEVEGLQTSMPVREALLQQAASTQQNTLAAIGEDVSAKNSAYNKMMVRRVATAFVAGTVAGAVVGTVVQEAVGLASPAVAGVFEHQEPGKANTLLNSILFGQKNNDLAYGPEMHDVATKNANANLKLPEGLELHPDKSGTVDIVDTASGKTVASNLEFTKYGHLSDESIKQLQDMGVKVNETVTTVGSEPKAATAQEFYKANKNALVHVDPTLMMNNTANNPDLNELRFYAAGQDGSWMDKNGNINIRVDGITENGSFQGKESVNPLEAVKKGELKVFMSPDKAHGLDTFAFTVTEKNGHYQVVIPKNHPAHQLFSERTGGKGASEGFNGQYLGTAVDRGVNARGVHDYAVINSIKGSSDAEFTVGSSHKVVTTSLEFTTLSPTETAGTLPVVSVPVYPRRGIGAPVVRRERLLPTPELIGRPDGYYGGYFSPERRREWEDDRSPRLKANPEAVLNPGEELRWYRDQLRARDDGKYELELQQQIDTIPELHDLPATTKAIICIPIAAASEADNIYQTLSLYAQQEEVTPGETTLLLHVNWVDDALNDPAKKAAIEKTKAEIERARANFPDLRIAVVETEWDKAFMDTQNGIIGHVARKMSDIAMLSATRAIDVGTLSPDQDMLVIRNDADAQGMSRHYLRNMLKNFEEHAEADAFVGGMRWETAKHSMYPGFGVSSNFREVMQALTGRPGSKTQVPTIGINHAVRISTLAAVGGLGSHNYTGAGSDDLEVQGRVYAARGESSASQSGYGTGYGTGTSAATQKRPIRYVVGAQIDSSADRVMAAYFGGGNGFVDAWNDFDKGGYKEPNLGDIPKTPEDPEKDIDSIAANIERDISNMATNWFNDPARVRTGLAFMFPDATKAGRKVYSLSFNGGKCTFKFTPEGKQWLKNRLMRDTKGRFDPFGSRAARALYGKTKAGAAKQPLAPASPLVQPT